MCSPNSSPAVHPSVCPSITAVDCTVITLFLFWSQSSCTGAGMVSLHFFRCQQGISPEKMFLQRSTQFTPDQVFNFSSNVSRPTFKDLNVQCYSEQTEAVNYTMTTGFDIGRRAAAELHCLFSFNLPAHPPAHCRLSLHSIVQRSPSFLPLTTD